MKLILVALFLSLTASAQNGPWIVTPRTKPVSKETIKVAIIDTGAQVTHLGIKEHLCENESEIGVDRRGKDKANNGIDDDGNGFIDDVNGWNFVDDTKDLTDKHGHGTHIAGLVALHAGSADYCIMILRYYDPKSNESNNLTNTVKAIRYAIKAGVKIINYSGGGLSPSPEESAAVKEFIDDGGIFVAAAGNERSNINVKHYYPAQADDRVVVVGATDKNGKHIDSSNYSKKKDDKAKTGVEDPEPMTNPETTDTVVEEEVGSNVFSTLPNDQFGVMTGSSQATAVMTGSLVNRLSMVQSDKYFKILYDRKAPKKPKPRSCNVHHRNQCQPGGARTPGSRGPAQAASYAEAQSKALDAAYMQCGLKGEVDEMVKQLQHQYISKDMEREFTKYGLIPSAIVKAILDHQFTLKWTF